MAIKGRKTAMSAEDNKIGGLNVYHDEKGRPVYLNRMNHVGYVLTDKTKPFRTYSSRFLSVALPQSLHICLSFL